MPFLNDTSKIEKNIVIISVAYILIINGGIPVRLCKMREKSTSGQQIKKGDPKILRGRFDIKIQTFYHFIAQEYQTAPFVKFLTNIRLEAVYTCPPES